MFVACDADRHARGTASSASSIACASSAISGCLHDARRALERVREAQQPLHARRRRCLFSSSRMPCANWSRSSRASSRKYL